MLALRTALARSDGVIVCGGLGPTQDDITREAIAEVMNVSLHRDEAVLERISGFFAGRGRMMTDNNSRQADVPDGAAVIEQTRGTAPGLICPVGQKVVYAVPGVPHEMMDMFTRAIRPDLVERMHRRGEDGVIVSRVLRTWGTSESALAEALDGRVTALDGPGGDGGSPVAVTLAFLASGIEGIKVRLTARAGTDEAARALLVAEETETRRAIADAFGDIVFGTDDQSMEHTVAARLLDAGLTLGLAESLTGGLIASRLVGVEGASRWFKGSVVAYDSAVKYELLDVPSGPVVSERAAVRHGRRRAPPARRRHRPGGDRSGRPRRAGGATGRHRVRRPGLRPRPAHRGRVSATGRSRAGAPVRRHLGPRHAAAPVGRADRGGARQLTGGGPTQRRPDRVSATTS